MLLINKLLTALKFYMYFKKRKLPSIFRKTWLDSAALPGDCSHLYVIIRKLQHFTLWVIFIEWLVL